MGLSKWHSESHPWDMVTVELCKTMPVTHGPELHDGTASVTQAGMAWHSKSESQQPEAPATPVCRPGQQLFSNSTLKLASVTGNAPAGWAAD